ncbi:MAG: hypothetical protein LBG94_05575 [Treponema sp.]|nr:hypothetical protein [Treponema sp.]
MKNLFIFSVVFFCGFAQASAKEPLFGWNLLLSGSWDESASVEWTGPLQNRAEFKLDILPVKLSLRAQVLDKRTLSLDVDSFQLDEFFPNPEKDVTNFTGGVYHKPTGSRILYGVLDEWGLPARIRNPWIRSPPYTGNRGVIAADLKTAASGAKEDEVYLYLSGPSINFLSGMKVRGFISAQTEMDELEPSFSGGFDLTFGKKINLLLDLFYTGKELPQAEVSAWFSNPPVLPEREYRLFAVGFLFSCPLFAVSSDFAFSETFAWGKDIYANLGITVTPLLPFGAKERPLSVSFAADGAGERFIYRDGLSHGEGFRSAGKIEWKSRYNSLLRLDVVLRGPAFGEGFNRSSTGFYYRFPVSAANRYNLFRFTRISFSADRNAVNHLKISDNFSGTIGLSISLRQLGIKSPFSVNLSGSVKGLSVINNPAVFPLFEDSWLWNSTSAGCEIIWSPLFFRFSTRVEYLKAAEKPDKWGFSFNASARFKNGRLSINADSPDFPDKWDWALSWRLELRNSK